MKRTLNLICLLAVALLLPAAAMLFRELPAAVHPYIEEKYAGWSGVLRAWVCSEWEPGGSLLRWLNACAADFEKRHEGVYVEFTPVRREEMRAMAESGIRPPEMLFFSPGVLTDGEELSPIGASGIVRTELEACGDGRALPVAMGGYIWVYNRALCPESFSLTDAPVALPDDGGRSFSAALVALMSGAPEAEGGAEEEISDPGLDLGLPAAADAPSPSEAADSQQVAPEFSADALERFLAGELAALPVSQRELARLVRLRDAGRGPDWACAATGDAAYTDQLLLAGAVAQADGDGAEREALAREFIALLCSGEMQSRLADVGAFSVTGARIYSDFSAYAPLDGLLNGRRLIAAHAFSEYSARDCGGIVREFCAGRLERTAAIAAMEEKVALQFLHNHRLY